VNPDVDEMKTNHIETMDIMIEGKAEVRQGALHVHPGDALKGFDDLCPGPLGQLDILIADDIFVIVEVPGTIQAVSIDHGDQQANKGNGSSHSPLAWLFHRWVHGSLVSGIKKGARLIHPSNRSVQKMDKGYGEIEP
jgi:hypothetical protein